MVLVKLAYNLPEAYMLGAEKLEAYNWIMLEDIFSCYLKSDMFFLSVVKFCFYDHIYLSDFMTFLLSIFLQISFCFRKQILKRSFMDWMT